MPSRCILKFGQTQVGLLHKSHHFGQILEGKRDIFFFYSSTRIVTGAVDRFCSRRTSTWVVTRDGRTVLNTTVLRVETRGLLRE